MNYISGTVVLRIHVSVHFTYNHASAFIVYHKDNGEPEKVKEQHGKEKLTEWEHKLKDIWKKVSQIYCFKKNIEVTSHSAIKYPCSSFLTVTQLLPFVSLSKKTLQHDHKRLEKGHMNSHLHSDLQMEGGSPPSQVLLFDDVFENTLKNKMQPNKK